MKNTERTIVCVHLATNRASDFGPELALKRVDYVRVITLLVFFPGLFRNNLYIIYERVKTCQLITTLFQHVHLLWQCWPQVHSV